MPFTKRQLDAILKVDNHSLLDDSLPLSLRVTETWVKRRAFVMEDQFIADLLKAWRDSYQSIRKTASALGDRYRLNTLALDNTSLEWRRALLDVVDREARKLAAKSAEMAIQAALKQYLFGYYGQAWSVSQGAPALDWRIPRPYPADATQRILRGQIREAFDPDKLIYDLLGAEWRDAYEDVLSDMVGKIRNSLTQSISQRVGIDAAARALAQVMGIDTGDKKAFGRINTLSRTYMMGAANSGALQLYEQNKHLLDGYIWYATMGDGRACRVCRGLHGTFYAFDDPYRKVPPYDSHPNCRCAAVPSLKPQAGYDYWLDAPPDDTIWSWLDKMGEWWLLDEFNGKGRKIDTPRIGDFEDEPEGEFA